MHRPSLFRFGHSCALVGSTVYLFGGSNTKGDTTSYNNDLYTLDRECVHVGVFNRQRHAEVLVVWLCACSRGGELSMEGSRAERRCPHTKRRANIKVLTVKHATD